jgi:hypothetical protein
VFLLINADRPRDRLRGEQLREARPMLNQPMNSVDLSFSLWRVSV